MFYSEMVSSQAILFLVVENATGYILMPGSPKRETWLLLES